MAKLILVLLLLSHLQTLASTITITFDDIPTQPWPAPDVQIQSGYKGLQWTNFFTKDGVDAVPYGDQAAVVSLKNIALNEPANSAASFGWPGGVFDLNSAYLTASYVTNLWVSAVGRLNGAFKYQKIVYVKPSGPLFVTYNFTNVDTVIFTTDNNVGINPGFNAVDIDNLSVTIPDAPRRIFLTSTNTAVIAWPVAWLGLAVQQNLDLATTNWVIVPNPPSVVGNENQVVLSIEAKPSFFRVVMP